MRNSRVFIKRVAIALSALLLVSAVGLAQVTVSLPTVTSQLGNSVTIPVTVANLPSGTGNGVISYQFKVTYNPAIVTITGISKVGTMSAGMSVTPNLTPAGTLTVTAASGTALTGTGGTLLYINATMAAKGSSNLTFDQTFSKLNEGTPAATFTDGSVIVPSLSVKLSDLATNARVGQTFELPITTEDLTGLNVYSYQFTVNFDNTKINLTGYTKTGTLSAGFAVTPNTAVAGKITIAAAGGTALSGAGTLLKLVGTVVATGTSNVTFQDFFKFNEGTPAVGGVNGSVSVALNVAPAFTAKLANVSIPEGALFTFAYVASDADAGQTVTYKLESGPTGATLSAAGVLSWTPAYGTAGSYPVVVSASDGTLADTAKATITVTHVNRAPAFAQKMSDVTIAENQAYTFTFIAVDPDAGTTINYKLELGPIGATLSASGVFSWTPTFSQSGSYPVIVSASDGSLADTAKATITVTNVNRAPAFTTKMSDVTIAENQAYTFTYVASDPDGTTLTYKLEKGPTGATVSAAGVFAWTPSYTQSGVYDVVVSASDGALADTAKAKITVTDVNRKPVFVSRVPSGNNPISRNVATKFSVSASDPDGGALTFQWKVNGAVVQTSGDSTYTATFADAHGTAKIVTAIFTDVGGLSDSTVWNFTITAVENATVPTEFYLGQNYPNPFNPSTTIRFSLPTESPITFDIYNMLGVKIRTLMAGETRSAGFYTVSWDGRDDAGVGMPSGVYLYRIHGGTFLASKKMTLLK